MTRNREVVERLSAAVIASKDAIPIAERMFYIWGEPGSGKTHLLQSACRLFQEQGDAPAYLPLAEVPQLAPAMAENLEQTLLVCVDDIQHIAGDDAWESALFSLYERMRTAEGTLVVVGPVPPGRLGLNLPDLATRLGWGLVYQLHPLVDEEKLRAIRLRAGNRGLDVSEDVARYLLQRYPRDMHTLFHLLERIDQASLAKQRRITIPFIRELE